MDWRNPIIPGFYPDPSICRVGRDYYLVTSSFEYFPGVPIFHSRDLVNWTQIGHCLTRDSQISLHSAKSSGGIFAPTIRHHEGRFYMITTDTTGMGNFFVWTDDPAGEWSDPVLVPLGGIDPSLLFHEGHVYFASNGLHGQNPGLYLAEIALDGRPLTDAKLLWTGTGGKFPEGPHLYPKDGMFYLLAAEGGTEFGHMVTIARSEEIRGLYVSCPQNPILSHRSTSNPLQSTGHADLVEDIAGDWWMVFHGVRHTGYPQVHHMGRETCLGRVNWPKNEWPFLLPFQPLPLRLSAPDCPSTPVFDTPFPIREEFESERFSLQWNFRRNPIRDAWSLARRVGSLSLRCTAACLDDVAPMAFIGRRQQHFDCRVETCITFDPQNRGEEAGLVAIMNERYYAALIVSRTSQGRAAFLRRRVGDLRVDGPTVSLSAFAGLRIVAEESAYYFSVSGGSGWDEVGMVETRHLSTEIAGGFTGVYFGLFASGSGTESERWAEFDWFDYEPLEERNPDRLSRPVTSNFWTANQARQRAV